MFMFSSSSVPHLITLNLAKNGAFAALIYVTSSTLICYYGMIICLTHYTS